MIGLGANISKYTFPVQFNGESKSKIDDSSTLFGPSLNIGYDVVLFNRLLLGLRAEGFLGDTLGTGAKDTSKVTDKTTGKVTAGILALRTGWIFDFNSVNLVGDQEILTGEFFLEGGISSGHKSFGVDYTTTDGVTEEYHENLEEEFQGRILSAGLNITTPRGAFFEIKVTQNTPMKNKQTFTGTELVNGGATVSTNQKLEDENLKSLTSLLLIVGHHY